MSFSAIPPLPQGGVTEEQFRLLASFRENIALLTGQEDKAFSAVLKGSVTVKPIGDIQTKPISVTGTGYSVTGGVVPAQEEFNKLVVTVSELRNDALILSAKMDNLIKQLSAS